MANRFLTPAEFDATMTREPAGPAEIMNLVRERHRLQVQERDMAEFYLGQRKRERRIEAEELTLP